MLDNNYLFELFNRFWTLADDRPRPSLFRSAMLKRKVKAYRAAINILRHAFLTCFPPLSYEKYTEALVIIEISHNCIWNGFGDAVDQILIWSHNPASRHTRLSNGNLIPKMWMHPMETRLRSGPGSSECWLLISWLGISVLMRKWGAFMYYVMIAIFTLSIAKTSSGRILNYGGGFGG